MVVEGGVSEKGGELTFFSLFEVVSRGKGIGSASRQQVSCRTGPLAFYIKLYIVADMKAISFHGTSLSDIKDFPQEARRATGFQLARVQTGLEPADWKPMVSIGHGVNEIRIKEDNGQYRIVYVAKFADAVHVLHAFQKKTKRTAKADIDLARKRYHEIGVKP